MYPDIFEYATFSFQFQKFSRPHVFKIEFARPHLSDGIRIHSRETMPTRCATILVYYSVRDWKVFLCYRIRNNRNNRPRVIGFVSDLIFSSLSLPNSPDACGWKPCAERKKVRIKKYPDTCGRDLTDLFLEQQLAYLPCNICPMLTHAAACAFLTSPQRHRSLVVCAELKGYTVVMIAAIVVIAGVEQSSLLPVSI